ncbi:MAG: ribonuclease P protein component [Candidatus Paceibacterota bacterium]
MLPLKNRLKKKKDFEKVFKKGASTKGAIFFLKAVFTQNQNTRIGFVVSKKISNKAVVRNKVKRRLRAIMRKLILQIKDGYDMIIVASPIAKDSAISDMEKDITTIFKRSGLFKK